MVEQVNRLYDEGHKIILQTARGRGSGIDQTDLTIEQLERWGVKYHELEPMFHKPTADIFIDDKGINVEAWKKTLPLKKGSIASSCDSDSWLLDFPYKTSQNVQKRQHLEN